MPEEKKYPMPYADLRVKVGSYEKDGKTKNRYQNVGTLFATPHFSNMYIQLDTLPITKDWDGRIYINPREENRVIDANADLNKPGGDVVIEDIDDKPIDLSEIPF